MLYPPVDWLQRGLNTPSIDEKILAFKKATELDPNYVEAHFYLGLAYKAKEMYPEAEVQLNKAYFINDFKRVTEIYNLLKNKKIHLVGLSESVSERMKLESIVSKLKNDIERLKSEINEIKWLRRLARV